MSWFHRHKWVKGTVTFTPPVTRKLTVYDQNVFERAVHGFTTITLYCAECGDLKDRKIVGRIEP